MMPSASFEFILLNKQTKKKPLVFFWLAACMQGSCPGMGKNIFLLLPHRVLLYQAVTSLQEFMSSSETVPGHEIREIWGHIWGVP